ncbi:hypothetical protein ACFB49_07650 [Sphingomonas sp. DBB INV C78]|uniref:S8 family peptidase n=1 Tax=Sphingomonas sp. DBB INV C78 TaxID=3349434 RepID=UPI0036D3BACC
MIHPLRTGSALILAASLSACGGGGGVNSAGSNGGTIGTPTPTPTPAPTPTPTDTREMRYFDASAAAVNGAYIFTSGWQGQGVTVGVMDDGAVATTDLAGQIDTANSRDFGQRLATGQRRNAIGDSESDHGTQVATVIAGKYDGAGTVGFAPKARIAVLRITDVDTDGSELFDGGNNIEALDFAAARGIKVVNRSLAGGDFPEFAAAAERYAGTGGLLVNSAGNDGEPEPTEAPNLTAANRASWIIVGAIGSGGTPTIADYSNRAGSAADRFVVAPGSNITTGVDGQAAPFSGTSSAAPVVSALAADILSKWPQLTGQLAGDIILTTAQDLGAPGVDAIYGHGLVDFRAALSPVNPTLSNGITQTSLGDAAMMVPEAIDPTLIQTALTDVTLLDAYGRDYAASLSGMVVKPDSRDARWLRRRIRSLAGGGQAAISAGPLSGSFGYTSSPVDPEGNRRSAMTTGEVAFRAGRTTFHAAYNAQDSLQRDIMGLAPVSNAVLAYAPQIDASAGFDRAMAVGRVGFTFSNGGMDGVTASAITASLVRGATELRVSLIDEEAAVLGARSSGALKLGRGATTAVIEAHHRLELGEWSVEGYASVGATQLKIDRASLITDATPLIGNRFGVQATRPALGGALSLGVAQPLMIESGTAHLTFGSGYDVTTQTLRFANVDVPLSGERRFTLTAGYALATAIANVWLGVMHDVRDASTGAILSLGVRLP